MSGEVPKGWERTTLAAACEFFTDGDWVETKDQDPDGEVRLIQLADIGDGTFLDKSNRFLTAQKARDLRCSLLEPGDLLIARMAEPIARCCLFPGLDQPAATVVDVAIARAREGVDQQFLSYAVSDRSFRELALGAASGTTRSRVSRSNLGALPTLLPPLDEQRRIAEVLRSVDDAIAANAVLLEGVKASKQGTMEAVLSVGFEEVRLETLLANTRYPMRSGPFGSALLKSELQPAGIPFLGIDNVHVERFVPVYRRFVSDEKYRELERYTVYPGDVMVTIMGTVGRCCVVPPDVGTAISSKHVWTLTIDQGRYSPALLAWQINYSPLVLEQLQGSAQGGIMSAISSGNLRDLMVPLPPPAEVRKVEELLLSFNAQIAVLEAEQNQVKALKVALMSDLLSGRVRVPAAVATVATKSAPPAFKRAVFAAEIVHQLHNDYRFGSVKHEKIVHLCELHLGLQDDLARHAYKEAAGPYDPKSRRSVETIFRQQKWFNAAKIDGNKVVYQPLENCGGHAFYFQRYFGDQQAEVQTMIDLLRPMNTQQCEIVATLYAVWNDFLIDGRQASDPEIVASVLNDWHPSKSQIAEDRWLAALPWMREHGLTPKGLGEKTRVVAK